MLELEGAQAISIRPILSLVVGVGKPVVPQAVQVVPLVDLYILPLKVLAKGVAFSSQKPKLAYKVPSEAISMSVTLFSAMPAVPLPATGVHVSPLSV